MSHSTVLVVGENPEEQLEPFCEDLEVEEYEEECWCIKDEKPNMECDECNGTGKRKTTYNPNSKWDWYEIGGRWNGFLKLKSGADGNQAKNKDVDWKKTSETFAVLKDGKWYEEGDMGWFGIVSNRKEKVIWNKEFKKLIDSVKDNDIVTVFDVHI